MILMMNCSYKSKDSNTQYFLEQLEKQTENSEILKLKSILNTGIEDFAVKLQKADALVIGAPLYVDGLPAQAVKLLEILCENYKGNFPNLYVYVVSNLGFYEAEQIKHLLDIVRNWCVKMGCIYGGGLAIGAGPMVKSIKNLPLESKLNKNIWLGLSKLSMAIKNRETMENYYTKTMIPRAVYIKAAHMTFHKSLKENNQEVSR